MACGAGALVVILSTFNGFENLSKSLNESFQPDLTITTKKNKNFNLTDDQLSKILKIKDIAVVSKILEEKVYIKYNGQEAIATLKGVDANYFQTNDVKSYIVSGDSTLENENYSFGLLGVGLAQKLNININNQFEQMAIYMPKTESSGMGLADNFELSYITPGGVFSIYQDYDNKYLIAPISFIQYLKNTDETELSALEIKLKSNDLSSTQSELKSVLGDKFDVKTKLELNASFYKITRIEKLVTFFILIFVIIILSFNFIGSLTMHIIEKTGDIKMLHYLGFKSGEVFNLYIIYGILQGMMGGIIGVIIGVGICYIQQTFGLIQMPGSGTFVVQDYPVQVQISDILWILTIIFVLSILASIFPAIRAKRVLAE